MLLTPIGMLHKAAASSFTEEETTAPGTAYLAASGGTNTPSGVPADTPTILFMAKYTQADSTRRTLWSASGTSDSFYAEYSGTNVQPSIRAFDTDNGTAGLGTNVGNDRATGSDFVILGALDAANNTAQFVQVDSVGGWGSAATIHDGSFSIVGATNLTFSTDALHLLARSDNQGHVFSGGISRLFFAAGITLPDITSSTVQDKFFSSSDGSLVDPATAQTDYTSGADFWSDFYKTDHWNLTETPPGTVSYTKTGTFT